MVGSLVGWPQCSPLFCVYLCTAVWDWLAGHSVHLFSVSISVQLCEIDWLATVFTSFLCLSLYSCVRLIGWPQCSPLFCVYLCTPVLDWLAGHSVHLFSVSIFVQLCEIDWLSTVFSSFLCLSLYTCVRLIGWPQCSPLFCVYLCTPVLDWLAGHSVHLFSVSVSVHLCEFDYIIAFSPMSVCLQQ